MEKDRKLLCFPVLKCMQVLPCFNFAQCSPAVHGLRILRAEHWIITSELSWRQLTTEYIYKYLQYFCYYKTIDLWYLVIGNTSNRWHLLNIDSACLKTVSLIFNTISARVHENQDMLQHGFSRSKYFPLLL